MSAVPQITAADKAFFDTHGYLVLAAIVDADAVAECRALFDRSLQDSAAVKHLRQDLGDFRPRTDKQVENITQIKWISTEFPELLETPIYRNTLAVTQELLGADCTHDFEMLIDKAPHTGTPTPFHSDSAYWPAVADERAVSFWIALDRATVENGCMWFVPGSHRQPLREHQTKPGVGAKECAGSEVEAVACPLQPGACTMHAGRTVHYTRGNSTSGHRRAFIINYRPTAMVRDMRARGFDHGLGAALARRGTRAGTPFMESVK